MSSLLPLPVALPLLVAPLLVAAGHLLRPRVDHLVAIATSLAVTATCAVVLADSQQRVLVHWFGGWRPRDGIAVGISFSVDPFGAGIALLAAALVTASLVFSWRYFDEAGKLFPVLMLVFLAGMCGFAYTGDLFNMFVFFELMGVAAYALTAYDPEETGPIQGAFNFAVTNSVGAFLILIGSALLYGRFGALNLAQLGQSVSRHGLDGLVVVALSLVLVGLLVKGRRSRSTSGSRTRTLSRPRRSASSSRARWSSSGSTARSASTGRSSRARPSRTRIVCGPSWSGSASPRRSSARSCASCSGI